MPHPEPKSAGTAGWKKLFPEPVAVLGYGVEGQSTLRHLLRRRYRDITVLDRAAPSEALPAGVRGVFGPDYLDGFGEEHGIRAAVRTVFRAPGVRPFVPEIEAFTARGGLLTSQVEAAFALLGRARIVGVTGTVGKGTCCSLLSAMLDRAGIPHHLAGNIGVPPLDALDALDGLSPGALLLLELSSFQLCTLRESPAAAIVLRTTTEHLDWHATREEYWDHKANIARYQKEGDFCVFFAGAEGSSWIGTLGAGRKIPIGESRAAAAAGEATRTAGAIRLTGTDVAWEERGLRLALSDTGMTGAFNLENIAAAAAAALELGAPVAAVLEGARAFAPLEHRLEFVRERDGVRYYNDSYATRPEAALAAVRAFRSAEPSTARSTDAQSAGPLGLILGGSEKFADFSELAAALAGEPHLRAIAFIGQTAERLEHELRAAGALEGRAFRRCASLEDALTFLRGEIRDGTILLSPACASFGLFKDYKERGKAFKRLVTGL